MFPRSILAGLLSAVFAGGSALYCAAVTAQTITAGETLAAPTDAAAPADAAQAAVEQSPRVIVPEGFTLSAPMADPSVPVIVAPSAPVATPAPTSAPTPSLAPALTPQTAPAVVHPQTAPSPTLRTPRSTGTNAAFEVAPQHLNDQPTFQTQPQVTPTPQSTSPAAEMAPGAVADPYAVNAAAQNAQNGQQGTNEFANHTTAPLFDPLGALLSGNAAPVKLAFLLPEADSPFEIPSQAILEGVLAANYAQPAPLDILLVRPGTNEPMASVLKRAAMAGAMAAIGPLDRSKVSEIAALDYLPLPVVTLNQVDMDTAVPLTAEELEASRRALEEKRASEQHIRELVIAETNALLSAEGKSADDVQISAGSIKTRSTVPGLVFAEELAVSSVRYEPIAFPRNLLMLGLSMEDDAARVARLGLAALPPATSQGERPKVLLLDHDTPLEKRVSAAFERELVAAGFAPDRLTVDLSQFQRVSKFFDLAVERLDSSEFNEALIDQEADPVGWRQQQIRIRRLKAAKRARAALSEPPYHAVFLAMDAKTASLVRSRLPIRSRIWGTPMINPGNPKTDPQANAMTFDLQQVALVESPLVLNFDAAEFEDVYRVPAPVSVVSQRLFALGTDAFAAATEIAHGTSSASFDGLLGNIAYNLTLSPKAERRGQTAMIFGGEIRVMDEADVVDYETLGTNSRRMRAQARSLERLQREAQAAAQKAGTLIDEESDISTESLDSYNFAGEAAGGSTPETLDAQEPSPAPAQVLTPSNYAQ